MPRSSMREFMFWNFTMRQPSLPSVEYTHSSLSRELYLYIYFLHRVFLWIYVVQRFYVFLDSLLGAGLFFYFFLHWTLACTLYNQGMVSETETPYPPTYPSKPRKRVVHQLFFSSVLHSCFLQHLRKIETVRRQSAFPIASSTWRTSPGFSISPSNGSRRWNIFQIGAR